MNRVRGHATPNDFGRLRVRPTPGDLRLTMGLAGTARTGAAVETRVAVKRFIALSCPARIVFDQSLEFMAEESARHRRKSADDDG
jgi:hypothetical protein